MQYLQLHHNVISAMSTDSSKKQQGCTNFKIRQLMRQVSQYYDTELAKAGLKATQYSLLVQVLQLGPIRPGDLAQAMRMDASTLTRNLKPLAEAGWLQIAAGPDARSRSITITDVGRAKCSEAKRYWRVAQERINQTLGMERVLALYALIDDALEQLSTIEDGAAYE